MHPNHTKTEGYMSAWIPWLKTTFKLLCKNKMHEQYKHINRNSLDFANLCGDKMFYVIAYIERELQLSPILNETYKI